MFGIKKRRILSWSVISSSLALFSCVEHSAVRIQISGETQGTTYTVILAEEGDEIEKSDLDSIFLKFDESLSTYVETSVISQINRAENKLEIEDPNSFFADCYGKSRHVYSLSNGSFDPSVFPLVSGWGFMNNMDSPLSKMEVDSILEFVSFKEDSLHSLSVNGTTLNFSKKHSNYMLDFNAIAQGLSVDVIEGYLRRRGYNNYFIEIGGEVSVSGKNPDGNDWRIGIDSPVEDQTSRELENIVHLTNKSIATSGNYRKFYMHNGVKYAHTLNPKTGFPVQHSLLSATVIANECALADAYATMFMVIGTDAALEFIANHPEEDLDVYLLYADENGSIQRKMSPGFSQYLEE